MTRMGLPMVVQALVTGWERESPSGLPVRVEKRSYEVMLLISLTGSLLPRGGEVMSFIADLRSFQKF